MYRTSRLRRVCARVCSIVAQFTYRQLRLFFLRINGYNVNRPDLNAFIIGHYTWVICKLCGIMLEHIPYLVFA